MPYKTQLLLDFDALIEAQNELANLQHKDENVS